MEPGFQNVYKEEVFWESFNRWVVRGGAETAYVDTDAGQQWSRDDLARLVENAGGRIGGYAGSLVAVHLPNGPDFVAYVLAAWRQGSSVLPIDGDMDALSADKLCEQLGVAARIDSGGIWPCEGAGAFVEGPALIKLTSGSTGAPRGVHLSLDALARGVEQIAESMQIGSADRTLLTLPLSHSYGFDNAALMLARFGAPIIAARDLTPTRLCRVIREQEPTVWPAIPFMLDVMSRSRGVNAADLASLRLVISAGAPLPAATRRQFAERFGIRPRTFYGSTECGGITFDRAGSDDFPEGAVGTPLVGVEVTLEEAESGGVGRVRVSSAAVGRTYLPEPSAELSGGSFLTADLGRLDELGQLILLGRASDVVNVGARKVYPAEIESVIRQLEGVEDVVVVAADRETASESLRAILVGTKINARTVQGFCEANLPAWKVPKRIEFRKALPRNVRGKLDRRRL